jgi:hypothetical protein
MQSQECTARALQVLCAPVQCSYYCYLTLHARPHYCYLLAVFLSFIMYMQEVKGVDEVFANSNVDTIGDAEASSLQRSLRTDAKPHALLYHWNATH